MWSLVRVVGSYPQTNVGGAESYFTAERKLNCGKTSKSQSRGNWKGLEVEWFRLEMPLNISHFKNRKDGQARPGVRVGQ